MRDPIETGWSVQPRAEARQKPGECLAFRMPPRLPKIDASTQPWELADDVEQARWPHRNVIKMFRAGRCARQQSSRFSVVALLASLWRPF